MSRFRLVVQEMPPYRPPSASTPRLVVGHPISLEEETDGISNLLTTWLSKLDALKLFMHRSSYDKVLDAIGHLFAKDMALARMTLEHYQNSRSVAPPAPKHSVRLTSQTIKEALGELEAQIQRIQNTIEELWKLRKSAADTAAVMAAKLQELIELSELREEEQRCIISDFDAWCPLNAVLRLIGDDIRESLKRDHALFALTYIVDRVWSDFKSRFKVSKRCIYNGGYLRRSTSLNDLGRYTDPPTNAEYIEYQNLSKQEIGERGHNEAPTLTQLQLIVRVSRVRCEEMTFTRPSHGPSRMGKNNSQSSRKKAAARKRATTKATKSGSATINASTLEGEMNPQQQLLSGVEQALADLDAAIEANADYLLSIGVDVSGPVPEQPIQRSYETEIGNIKNLIAGLHDDVTKILNDPLVWHEQLVEAKSQITGFMKANSRRKEDKISKAIFNFEQQKRTVTVAAEQLSSFVLDFNVTQTWFVHVQGLLDDLKVLETDNIKKLQGPTAIENDPEDQGHGTPYVTPPTSTTIDTPVNHAAKRIKIDHQYDDCSPLQTSDRLQMKMDKIKFDLIRTWMGTIETGKARYQEAREVVRKYEARYNIGEPGEAKEAAKETGKKRKGGAGASPIEKEYQPTDLEYFDTNPFHEIRLTLLD
ncbi:hypothetical protein Dda_5336 [Drechslerella dactyloides]|uniref:Uncharacterized protein n=1 Tax=Drechslerella dactyloides TaxID=74499 RepID=A0AAD6IVW7_DREDA|nr:hypothetical protein Dda_5336 [Drechslerella dactyloides]